MFPSSVLISFPLIFLHLFSHISSPLNYYNLSSAPFLSFLDYFLFSSSGYHSFSPLVSSPFHSSPPSFPSSFSWGFRPSVQGHPNPVLCAQPLIDIVMRLIPTSHSPCTLPLSLSSPTPIYPRTLPHLLFPLCSLSPRVARLILFHHTSNRPDALRAGRTQGLQHLHRETYSNVCAHVWGEGGLLRPPRGGGRTRYATSRCHRDLNSRLGGCRGERDVAWDPPLQPSLGREERGEEPESLLTLHLCSILLFSPCSLASPPAPPFDSTIR